MHDFMLPSLQTIDFGTMRHYNTAEEAHADVIFTARPIARITRIQLASPTYCRPAAFPKTTQHWDPPSTFCSARTASGGRCLTTARAR